jgi:hypothetical protein
MENKVPAEITVKALLDGDEVDREVVLKTYAKKMANKYTEYTKYQYEGKNGANSDNEKGYWRGMADNVLAVLTDLKRLNLIAHTGLFSDKWPEGDVPHVDTNSK